VDAPPPKKPTISSGSDPIDKALLGGLGQGSLTLIEGPSGTGKSVLVQHLAYGALMAEMGTAYYVSGMGPEGLIGKMNALYLDVTPNLKEGQFRVRGLADFAQGGGGGKGTLDRLYQDMKGLPWEFTVIVVDTLTSVINSAGSDDSLKFFMACKEICSWEKAIIMVMHTSSMDPDLLKRLDNLFDNHLSLRMESLTSGTTMKTMHAIDVCKVRNTTLKKKTSIYFEVDPELGRSMNMSLKVLPFFKTRV
jgi:archaellum biogenesis ATPase FlaH